jgi:LynF/TruF/PatF family peptide O-prenyltransferase
MANPEQKYSQHLATFGETPSQLSRRFECLVRRSPKANLECSCKIRHGDIFAKRLNLWFKNGEDVVTRSLVEGFLDECAGIEALDFTIYRRFLDDDFQREKVVFTVLGIDERERWVDSRVKLWKIVADYPELEERLLSYRGLWPMAKPLKIHRGLLFGVEFGFSGTTGLRVYPVWHDFQMDKNYGLLQRLLGREVVSLAKKSRRISFAFSSNSSDVALHILPIFNREFLRHVGSEKLTDVVGRLPANDVIVSLSHSEVLRAECRSFNVYY